MTRLNRRPYIVPVLSPFPVWKFGRLSNLWGEYVRDGWWADRYYYMRFGTEREGEAWIAAQNAKHNPGR